jgi:hypothetical protein
MTCLESTADVTVMPDCGDDALKSAVQCFHSGTGFYSHKLAIEYLLNIYSLFERLGFDTAFVSGLEVAIAIAAVLREGIAEDDVGYVFLFCARCSVPHDSVGSQYVVTAWRQLWLKYFSAAVDENRFDRAFTAIRSIADFDKVLTDMLVSRCFRSVTVTLCTFSSRRLRWRV